MSATKPWGGYAATAVHFARQARAQFDAGQLVAAFMSIGLAWRYAGEFDGDRRERAWRRRGLDRLETIERVIRSVEDRLCSAISDRAAKPAQRPRPKRAARPVPEHVARVARELRVARQTRSGKRAKPWNEIADELERRGLGRFKPADLSQAVEAHLAIDAHPLAPLPKGEQARIERTWRDGWAEEFPGEPWPGLEVAQKRLRDRAIEKHNAEELEKLGAVKAALERALGGGR